MGKLKQNDSWYGAVFLDHLLLLFCIIMTVLTLVFHSSCKIKNQHNVNTRQKRFSTNFYLMKKIPVF